MNIEYKAGDPVVVRGGGWDNDFVRVGTVEAVTPTGQIILTDKTRFSAGGYGIGGGELLLPRPEENLSLYAAQELRRSIQVQAEKLLKEIWRMRLPELQRASEGLRLAMSSEPVDMTQEH